VVTHRQCGAHTVAEMPEQIRMLYEYHPDLARGLMADAGCPDGFKMELVTPSTILAADMGAVLKEQWSKVGIDLTLKPLEAAAISALRFSVAFKDARLTGVGSAPRQVADYTNLRIIRMTGRWDPDFDAMYLKAAQTADVEERAKLWKDVAINLIETGDFLMLPAANGLTLWWPWIRNYYGEINMGYLNIVPAVARMWVDEDLKKELGY